jgi:hypothetical protein
MTEKQAFKLRNNIEKSFKTGNLNITNPLNGKQDLIPGKVIIGNTQISF